MHHRSDQFVEVMNGPVPPDQFSIRVTKSGGIENVAQRSVHRKRDLVPFLFAKVIKPWRRQKHVAPSAESFSIVSLGSSFPLESEHPPSSPHVYQWHHHQPPSQHFSIAHRPSNTYSNVSRSSYTASTNSPHALTVSPNRQSENTRLKSYKSLGAIADKSSKLIYNARFNFSAKCLPPSAECRQPKSSSIQLSKDEKRARSRRTASSDRTRSDLRKEDHRFLHVSVTKPGSPRVPMPISASKSSRASHVKLPATRPLGVSSKDSRRGPSSDHSGKSIESAKSQTCFNLPVKVLTNKEVKNKFPAPEQHDITYNQPSLPKKAAYLRKKQSQTTQCKESRAKPPVCKRSCSQTFPSISRPMNVRSLTAEEEFRLQVPPSYGRNRTVSSASPVRSATVSPPFRDLPRKPHYHLNPQHSSKPQFIPESSSGAQRNLLFKDISTRASEAEAPDGQTLPQIERGSNEKRVERIDTGVQRRGKNCISITKSDLSSESTCDKSFFALSHPQESSWSIETSDSSMNESTRSTKPLPLREPTPEEDFTTSTYESYVYDDIEHVPPIFGPRLACADPPLKAIFQDMQSPPSPPRDEHGSRRESSHYF